MTKFLGENKKLKIASLEAISKIAIFMIAFSSIYIVSIINH